MLSQPSGPRPQRPPQRPDELRFEAVVLGASTGGVDALGRILPALPASLAIPVVVVVHQPANHPTLLPSIFVGRCAVPVREAMDKLPVDAGVWFAPSGYHLYIERDRTFALSVDVSENFVRPSVDVLFDAASQVYGKRLLAVVLTGANDDGAAGAHSVREAGGFVLVQDPSTALAAEMPAAAIKRANPQEVWGLAELPARLVQLIAGGPP